MESVDGVAAVKVKGGLEEEIRVELDERKITLMGLNIENIRQRLAQENVNLAGGNLKEGQSEYVVRTLNEFKNVKEIGDIAVGFQNGRQIRLKDIAHVYRTNKERQMITRLNGRESVELEVYREGDANIVEVARRVRAKVFGTPQQQAFVQKLKAQSQFKGKGKGKGNAAPSPMTRQARRKAFMMQMKMRSMTDFINYKLPKGMHLTLLTDQSVFINNSLSEVRKTAVYGGILAIIVLFLFLNNARTTLIVGLSIPISIIATFAPMRLFGISLNIMSLGGLALGIGMLVDNSIVVTESIFRCREEGDDLLTAVVRGTHEVGSAVTASTLTTIAVFFPMVFVQGVAGQIFGDLSLAVVFSLLASLAVALFFIPMLASREFKMPALPGREDTVANFLREFRSWVQLKENLSGLKTTFFNAARWKRWAFIPVWLVWLLYAFFNFLIFFVLNLSSKLFTLLLLLVGALLSGLLWVYRHSLQPAVNFLMRYFHVGLEWLYEGYPKVINWALENRMQVISLAVLPFLFTVFVIFPRLGSELIPEVHRGVFNVDITLPVGTPVETTVQTVKPIEAFIEREPGVAKVATVAGVDLTKISDSESGEHTAKITVTLKPSRNPVELEEKTIAAIRRRMDNFSGMEYNISRPVLFSFKTPIEVEIKGYNLSELTSVSREAVRQLSRIPGLHDVKSNLQSGNPEVQITYDRKKLSFLGLNVLDVANIVRNKVRGDVATQFKDEDRRLDVLVKVRDKDKESLQRLRMLNVNPKPGIAIPLQSVANIQVKEGPSEIRRIDQQRSAVIMANISGRDLSSVSADVFNTMQNIELPADFSFEITGQNKEMQVSLGSLKMALLLAIFMVYIVMASQFESFLHPFVILFTVPFALIGVAVVLWIAGIPLNVMVFLGVIMLAGIVVNNAIVLVDYINQLRRNGMAKLEAIKLAGRVRLRPILMTTATTVLGLLPMALGLGDGAEIRTPMAITVIAGLISSTVLTLVVIPTFYAIFEKGD